MNNENKKIDITPDTKVGQVLDAYPHLESVLIEMTPAFSKLRHPILRKTVGKVAILQQVAEVGKISLATLINTLRQKAGISEEFSGAENNKGTAVPPWFEISKITMTLDARAMLEAGKHPLGRVLAEVNELTSGQIYELTTSFVPVPLIEKVQEWGFAVWTKEEEQEIVKSYFCKT